MTPISDIGIVIPVIYENLIPVFADIDPETYNINPDSVEKCITKKTKAIIAVHLSGNPCDLDALKNLCKKYKLILIEDFSQAHGTMWKGKKAGSYGSMAYGSFQQSKQITCGEGGVIVTNDAELARRAFIGVDKAWQRHLPLEKRFYEFLAPNLRFNALQAAILTPQINRLDTLIEKKRTRAAILLEMLAPYENIVKSQKILKGGKHSYYSFPLYVHNSKIRDRLVQILAEQYHLHCAYGYAGPRTLYMCVNALINPQKYGKQLKYSKRKYPRGLCPQAEKLLEKAFLIPFNENYSEEEIKEIGNRLISALKQVQ